MIKKINNKLLNMTEEVKASFAFAICSVIQKGIQLFTVPIFTRVLTAEQYGQFSLYQTWLGVISIFATLNLASGVFNNGMLKYSKEREQYTSAMQGLSTMVTVGLVVLYVLFTDRVNNLLGLPTIVVLSMFMEMIFTPAYSFWSARQRYEFKYKALAVFTLLLAIVNPVIGLIAICETNNKGIARILSVCLVNIVAGMFFYIRNFQRGKLFYSKKYWKFALSFNLPLIPHYLSQIILSQSDRIMIEKMFGTTELAFYSVAYSVGLIMNIIVSSVNSSFIPWTYETIKCGNISRIRTISNKLILLMGSITLIPIIFAPEAVLFLGSKEYIEAFWVIPPISLSVFFTFIYSLFANIEFYYEKSKYVMIASSLTALANVVLNLLFMKIFGYIAAGYTTLFCYILLATLHFLFMRFTCKLVNIKDNIYDIKFISFVSFILFINTGLFMLLYKYSILRYVVFVVMMICLYAKRRYFLNAFKEIKNK